jgi:transposase
LKARCDQLREGMVVMTDDRRLWVGIDLGSQAHQVCVLNEQREVVIERTVDHSGAALSALAEELLALADGAADAIHVTTETPQSAVVETLLERGMEVFVINPKQLDRFRDRYSVAGAKDDRRDAFVLAQSLCTDSHLFKQVKLGSHELVELKALNRIRAELLEETNILCNRVDAELVRFFPEFRSLGSMQSDPWLTELLELAPSPAQAKKLRLPQLRVLLKKHKIRKHTAEQVHTTLSGPSVHVAPGVAEAASRHIQMLIPRLRLVREQERQCRRDLERLLEKLSEAEPDSEAQRDAAIVQSLPGAGAIVSATLLAEAWQLLAERDYSRLRSLSGVAPVTKRSGKSTQIGMRRACNERLRDGVYYWALSCVRRDERSKAHYGQLRARGHSHGRALRGVADRLLNLLVVLLRRGELFDPARRVLQTP